MGGGAFGVVVLLLRQVMEILTHINKRVKDQVSIKLPLIDLLKLYQSPDAVPMVRNFAIVYIEMAFERSTVEVSIWDGVSL
jgi:proteasome component ECM29